MFKILCLSIWLLFHPVHVTITSIDYIQKSDSFKVFVRMNFDDFILDCKLNGDSIQKENFKGINLSSRVIAEKYIRDKILIVVNEEPLSGKLQNMNVADNEISLNLEYSSEKLPKTIMVKNLIMTGLYADQSNMIIVRVNDFEEGVKLTADLTEQTFKIK
jgi:hypothetical protein